MEAEKKEKGWQSVSLPKELVDSINELIKNKSLGYTSMPEFVKEAVRLRIVEVLKAYETAASAGVMPRLQTHQEKHNQKV